MKTDVKHLFLSSDTRIHMWCLFEAGASRPKGTQYWTIGRDCFASEPIAQSAAPSFKQKERFNRSHSYSSHEHNPEKRYNYDDDNFLQLCSFIIFWIAMLTVKWVRINGPKWLGWWRVQDEKWILWCKGLRREKRERKSAAFASIDLVRNESPGFDTLEGVIAPSLHAVVWDLLPAMQIENASACCCSGKVQLEKLTNRAGLGNLTKTLCRMCWGCL